VTFEPHYLLSPAIVANQEESRPELNVIILEISDDGGKAI